MPDLLGLPKKENTPVKQESLEIPKIPGQEKPPGILDKFKVNEIIPPEKKPEPEKEKAQPEKIMDKNAPVPITKDQVKEITEQEKNKTLLESADASVPTDDDLIRVEEIMAENQEKIT